MRKPSKSMGRRNHTSPWEDWVSVPFCSISGPHLFLMWLPDSGPLQEHCQLAVFIAVTCFFQRRFNVSLVVSAVHNQVRKGVSFCSGCAIAVRAGISFMPFLPYYLYCLYFMAVIYSVCHEFLWCCSQFPACGLLGGGSVLMLLT